ncbi:hypothetical protein HYV58_00485 [Candidatus Peregrinibacteria bacterium]|nr:hypothetical protein [Candidatus Peregrinibacteria bacterium]
MLDSGQATPATVILADRIFLRLSKTSRATWKKGTLTLNQGGFFIDSRSSADILTIQTPGVSLKVWPGIYSLEYRDGTFAMTAVRHSLEASFGGQTMAVPQGRTLTLSESKIRAAGESLKKLSAAKVMKEFPYEAGKVPDDELKKSLADAELFRQSLREKTLEEVRSKGPGSGGSADSLISDVGAFFHKANVFFTFNPERKQEKIVDAFFRPFDAGAYALLLEDRNLAGSLFSEFLAAYRARNGEFAGEPVFLDKISERANRFAFSETKETFFEAEKALRDVAYSIQPADRLRLQWNDILDVSARGTDTETRESVRAMHKIFQKSAGAMLADMKSSDAPAVLFMALLVNDFLLSEPWAINEDAIKTAEMFESAYLELSNAQAGVEEERQFFVAQKIQLLNFIRSMLEKSEISYQDGRSAMLLLMNHIQIWKSAFSDQAVAAYFDRELEILAPFIAFLRSPQGENITGDLREAMEDFQSHQDEMNQVLELLSTASGGTKISANRREELASIVFGDFQNLGVKGIQILLPESEDDMRVRIMAAEFEGAPFSGIYDTGRKVISDLTIREEKILAPVRLENFVKFFLIKIGKIVLAENKAEEKPNEKATVPTESLFVKASRAKLLKNLESLKIVVKEEDMDFGKIDEDAIRVIAAILDESDPPISFSFSVDQKTERVSGVKVQTVQGEIAVNDVFSISEVPERISQIYNRAVFDKEKEGEATGESQESP